jgi:hypothetical protein
MDAQTGAFLRFVRLLYDYNLLEQVIVIGSWAEFVYAQAGLLPGFEANLRTLDVDFLIRNMRRPAKPVNIIYLAKEKGYLVEHDVMTKATKLISPDLMEIEFLISQQGSGVTPVIPTNLGVMAHALRHLNVLRDNTVVAELLDMQIHVPCPEAYVIHKMVISGSRGKKAEKDRAAILRLMPYINSDVFRTIYDQLTKKERLAVDGFFTVNTISLYL